MLALFWDVTIKRRTVKLLCAIRINVIYIIWPCVSAARGGARGQWPGKGLLAKTQNMGTRVSTFQHFGHSHEQLLQHDWAFNLLASSQWDGLVQLALADYTLGEKFESGNMSRQSRGFIIRRRSSWGWTTNIIVVFLIIIIPDFFHVLLTTRNNSHKTYKQSQNSLLHEFRISLILCLLRPRGVTNLESRPL